MEKKRINLKIIIAIIVIIIFLICGICIMNKQLNMDDNTKKENQISYSNLTEALEGYYARINNTEDENQKEKLLKELKEYVLSDFQGYYYYRDDNTQNGSNFMRGSFPENFTNEKDDRMVYVKSKDEVYIFPYSEEYIKENNIDIKKIDSIENSELYKYKITSIETSEHDGAYNASKSAKIELQTCYNYNKYGDAAYKDFTKIEFKYYTSDINKYTCTGFFADMIGEKDDITKFSGHLSSGINYYRSYYRTLDLAEQKNIENIEYETKSKQEKENLKNSIPKIGMTESEVKQTRWGSPDKINKDTYSWGTTEQWVYNKYGYVYFRNGKVSSVSER